MQYEAGAQILVEARSSHSRADTTGDGTHPSCAFHLSRESIIIIGAMNIHPQQAGRSIKTNSIIMSA